MVATGHLQEWRMAFQYPGLDTSEGDGTDLRVLAVAQAAESGGCAAFCIRSNGIHTLRSPMASRAGGQRPKACDSMPKLEPKNQCLRTHSHTHTHRMPVVTQELVF